MRDVSFRMGWCGWSISSVDWISTIQVVRSCRWVVDPVLILWLASGLGERDEVAWDRLSDLFFVSIESGSPLATNCRTVMYPHLASECDDPRLSVDIYDVSRPQIT